MNPAIAASCTTGSWTQKWDCGLHEPTTGAANAGYYAGHNIAPWLIIAVVIVLIAIAASRSRSRTPAASKN